MTATFVSHCEIVYNALLDRSTINKETDEMVFTGAISQVYGSLGISQSYYGPIFDTLEEVGAILKLQRGGRGVDSVLVLRGLPKVWPEGLGWRGRNANPLTSDTRYDTLSLDLQRVKESIGDLNVIRVLMDFETRLSTLEATARKSGAPHGKESTKVK